MFDANAKTEKRTNCPTVGLTQVNALTDPNNIHKAATILAAKFREKRGNDSIFSDDNDKASSFFCTSIRLFSQT